MGRAWFPRMQQLDLRDPPSGYEGALARRTLADRATHLLLGSKGLMYTDAASGDRGMDGLRNKVHMQVVIEMPDNIVPVLACLMAPHNRVLTTLDLSWISTGSGPEGCLYGALYRERGVWTTLQCTTQAS